MKNYYKILGVKQNITTQQLKEATKIILNKLKKSDMEEDKKKIKLKEFEEAYNFLNDYHKRRELDNYLERNPPLKMVPLKLSNELDLISSSLFPKLGLFDNLEFPDISKMSKDNKSGSFYHQSSYSSSKIDEKGNLVTEQKTKTNENGKINESHKIISKDKDGNEIIKEVPVSKSKKSIRYKV